MSACIRLSTADLGFFFEKRHRALATDLERIGNTWPEDGRGLEAAHRVARELGEKHGLYALLVPESAGGFPVGHAKSPSYIDLRSVCLVREMLGQVSATADSIFAVHGLGSYPIALAGSPAQRAYFLPRVVSGDAIGAFALTEPVAGSDVGAVATVARKEGSGFIIDGEKAFVSNAGIATHYIVFANANPSAGRRGIAAFVVEQGTPGLEVTPVASSSGHPLGRLRLSGCRVVGDALLGEIGAGHRLAMQTLDTFRATIGAAAIGMARRAFEETRAHVRARKQFGRPLAELQLVQGHLADMATELDAARLLVFRAAVARDSGQESVTTEGAMAKLYATEAAQRIIDRAVQLFGGIGVTTDSIVERLYREVRPLRIYEGASDLQRIIIANGIVTSPKAQPPQSSAAQSPDGQGTA